MSKVFKQVLHWTHLENENLLAFCHIRKYFSYMKDYSPSSTSSIAELIKIKIHISFPYFFSPNMPGSITYDQTAKPICLKVILIYTNRFLLVLKYECSVQLYTQCFFLNHYWFFVIRQISVHNFPMIYVKHGIKCIIFPWFSSNMELNLLLHSYSFYIEYYQNTSHHCCTLKTIWFYCWIQSINDFSNVM